MQSADDVNLRDAEFERFLRLLDHLRQVVLVRAGITPPPVERAEVTVEDADVGVIDVAVEDVERDVAVVAFAHQVGHRADGRQIVRPKQPQAIFLVDALSGVDLLDNVAEFRPLDQFVHRHATSVMIATNSTKLIAAFMRKKATFTLTGSRFRASRC